MLVCRLRMSGKDMEQSSARPPRTSQQPPGRAQAAQVSWILGKLCLLHVKAPDRQALLPAWEHLFHSLLYSVGQCLLDTYCAPGPVVKGVITTAVNAINTIKEMYTVL